MIYIFVPAYNEEQNIGALLGEMRKTLGGADLDYRTVVVDGASSDGTGAILEDFREKMPLDLVTLEKNEGQGGAIRAGLDRILEEAADDDFIVTLDADSAHQPRDILAIYDKLLDGPDVVIASRYRRGGEEWGAPRWRKYLARSCNWLLHLCFPIEEVSDYTGSFRGFRAGALRRGFGEAGAGALKEKGFTVVPEILICLKGKGLSFYEIPLILRYDLKRGPKTRVVVSKVCKATMRLIYRKLVGDRPGRKK
jgi:dolichol-phosphate mannosyltransferase